jgi:hypothetical protein
VIEIGGTEFIKHMSDNQPKQTSESLAELEREIRSERKFSLEEVIMRLVGPGMMKGESPITRNQQAEAVIEDYLRRHLVDASGALPLVLFRHVKESERLLNNLDQPFVVLAGCVQLILDSEYLLRGFVREVDAQWRQFWAKYLISKKKDVRLIRRIRTRTNRFASSCWNFSPI